VSTNDEQSFNAKGIAEFRENGGRVMRSATPILLLTTIGAKSGLRRTTPLMYLADESDGNRLYLFASAAGADKHPARFHNLVAHPDDLTVEIGESSLKAAGEVVRARRGQLTRSRQALPGLRRVRGQDVAHHPVVALTLNGA
jgi:deazaflavin-dependent oxidoreductase (nitroreductase family)